MYRIRTVVVSGLSAFAILAAGQGAWGALLKTNLSATPAVPWSFPAMAFVLWGLWRFLSATPERRKSLRAYRAPGRTFVWAAMAGAFAAASIAGLWIVLFQVVRMPANALPSVAGYPVWTLAAMAVMGSIVAPVTEEAAFRGYCQSALERDFSGAAAILISSALFAAAHLTHGFYWPKLLVYFLFGAFMGTLAYISGSILPGIPAHSIADLTFFIAVWPYDSARPLIWQYGTDVWFWVHCAQAIVFGALAILALRRMARTRVSSASIARMPAGGLSPSSASQ